MKSGVYEIEPKEHMKALKRKHRKVCVKDGELSVSPEIAGISEKTAFLCCSVDGVRMSFVGKNVYVPVSWLKMEKPHLGKDLEKFEKMVKDSIETLWKQEKVDSAEEYTQ